MAYLVRQESQEIILKGNLKLLNGRKIKSPIGLNTRPTSAIVREAVMNILGNKISTSNWLDLCSGSGVMGCEALQHGAKQVLAVESNKKTAQICKSNLISTAKHLTGEKYVEVINSDAISFLKKGYLKQTNKIIPNNLKSDNAFELVYLDPPYKANLYTPILNYLILGKWVKNASLVICELSSEVKITTTPEWSIKDKRNYGKTLLLFLTPNQALHCHDDTDSRHIQKALG